MQTSDNISERACHDQLSEYFTDFMVNKFDQVKELFRQSLGCYEKQMKELLKENGNTYLVNFEEKSSIKRLQCWAEVWNRNQISILSFFFILNCNVLKLNFWIMNIFTQPKMDDLKLLEKYNEVLQTSFVSKHKYFREMNDVNRNNTEVI